MKQTILIVVTSFLLAMNVYATTPLSQVRYDLEDINIFEKTVTRMAPYRELPMNELVIRIALDFIDTPYVGGTLEIDPEMLNINMRETDCILLVEMCTALALTIKGINLNNYPVHITKMVNNIVPDYSVTPTFKMYCDNVRNLRYYNGEVNGYASRLHYTSAWIIQGDKRGVMHEVTRTLPNIQLDQKFFYMSRHSQRYRQLKENPALVKDIKAKEEDLNKYSYYYVSKDTIKSDSDKIQNGDIVCFVSTTSGIDISHVAFAFWVEDDLHFIHASSKEMKVVIEKKTLYDYTSFGIRLVRFTL